MKRITFASASILLVTLAAAAPALADIAPDPCMGKAAGDACTTPDNQDGTCKEGAAAGLLTCVASSSSSSSSSSGSSSSSSSSSGGDPEDDGGCSFRGGPEAPLGMVVGGLALFALGSLVARRRT